MTINKTRFNLKEQEVSYKIRTGREPVETKTLKQIQWNNLMWVKLQLSQLKAILLKALKPKKPLFKNYYYPYWTWREYKRK